MWLSDLSIKRPVFITMIFAALVVVGLMAYSRMGVDLFPDVSFPFVGVVTGYPGAGPEEVESQVSKPIEEAVSSLSGVKQVRSTSSEGLSMVSIEFQLEHPVSQAMSDVKERMGAIRGNLPEDIKEPVVIKYDPNSMPVMTLAVTDKSGSLPPDKLRKLVDDKIKPRIERLAGVAGADSSGGLEREIHVELSAERLNAQQITPAQVVNAINAQNVNVPAGTINVGDRQISLRTPGNFQRIEDIGQVVISHPGGIPVRVNDVATVTDDFKDRTSYTRMNGKDSVGIALRKQSGTNTVEVAKQVRDEVARLSKEYPQLNIIIASDSSEFISSSVNDTRTDLIIGAILAALVVFVFFRSVSNTLVTVAGLPVILIGTFYFMGMMGFTVNMMTLLALSLCIGLLIDDAIVVRENIFRHMEEGEDPKTASSKGTGEVALAVVSMTACVVSVFLPIAFTGGIVGKFMKEFGMVVTAAVIISLVEAFTLAPMMTAHFLGRRKNHKAVANNIKKSSKGVYERFLGWGLSHRLVVLGGAVLVFVGSLMVVPLVGMTFFAQYDQPQFEGYLELPTGSSLNFSNRAAIEIEKGLAQRPEVQNVLATVGSGNAPENVAFFIKVDDKKAVQPLQQWVRQQYGHLGKIVFGQDSMGGGSSTSVFSRPVVLELSTTGPFQGLDDASQKVMTAFAEIPGLVDIDRSLQPGKPEMRIEINREQAADLRLNVVQVGATLRTLINGETASKFRQGEDEVDIVVRLRDEDRRNPSDVVLLPLVTPRDVQVPLSSIARLTPATGPSEIDRRDRERIIGVGANIGKRPQGEVVADIEKKMQTLNLPKEITYKFGGQTDMMYESFNSLFIALALSIVFVYMVLASLYGSFTQPLIIMLALPLSIIGAMLALLITRNPMDMTAMIGVILLMGIVAKNSIIMVDFINIKRRGGLGTREAILAAAPLRLRPIMMTTLSLIFGMLAIAFGIGAGGEFRAPMAITVIGGLTTSTFLSLVIVPVAYSFFGKTRKL